MKACTVCNKRIWNVFRPTCLIINPLLVLKEVLRSTVFQFSIHSVENRKDYANYGLSKFM